MRGDIVISRYWSVGVAMAAVAVVFAMAGCGGGPGGSTGDSTPPSISVNYPTSTGPGASDITIQALVEDSGGIGSAEVILTKPDGTAVVLPMTSTDISTVARWYAVTFKSDANTTQAAKIYTFVVRATDASGNVASYASQTITVLALAGPPPPPF